MDMGLRTGRVVKCSGLSVAQIPLVMILACKEPSLENVFALADSLRYWYWNFAVVT